MNQDLRDMVNAQLSGSRPPAQPEQPAPEAPPVLAPPEPAQPESPEASPEDRGVRLEVSETFQPDLSPLNNGKFVGVDPVYQV